MVPLGDLWLAFLTLGAALVNGAVGYGFSSIITPVAILWFPNKVLNPALVIVEVVVNVALLTREWRFIRATWHRARPVVLTLLPGVILGTAGLAYLAVNDVKFVLYAVLFPLVILQLWGFSRPIRNERRGGAALGPPIGFLYALTTISGPPLALFLRNQGLSKNEFRCTIAQIRVAESCMALSTYLLFDTFFSSGLVAAPSLGLLPFLFVPVVVGVPVGTLFLSRVSPEFFRRFIMAVDGVFVSYGISRITVTLNWISSNSGYVVMGLLFVAVGVLAWISLSRLSRALWIEKTRVPPNGGVGPPGDLLPRPSGRTSVPADPVWPH
jgi:uncharacterized protein